MINSFSPTPRGSEKKPQNPPPWNQAPIIVIWELTRSCALACQHCRAEAQHRRDPRELTMEEGFNLIDQIAAIQPRAFVLTGGDPMNRPDLCSLIAYATKKGLRVSMSPSATPLFLQTDLSQLVNAGLSRVAISLDGATAATHDRFRGIAGTWENTISAIQRAREAGLEIQINTTFCKSNFQEFSDLASLVKTISPELWSVFLLVPTGRATRSELLTPEELEDLFVRLYHLSQEVPFDIKTTEGQHYRRVALQEWMTHGGPKKPSPLGVNDGKGFVFISHIGEICPSGFLPLIAGNVRQEKLLNVYQKHPAFQQLRNADALKGKCGYCEFRKLCGGSRARAFATTGDLLAEEPLCLYQPLQTSQSLQGLSS